MKFLITTMVLCLFLTLKPAKSENTVLNQSKYNIDDTILESLDYFGIKNVTVIVYDIGKKLSIEGIEYQALVIENLEKQVYTIYVTKDFNKDNADHIIRHECVHIWQYYTNRLVIKDQKTSFMGKGVKQNYSSRQYELEAEKIAFYMDKLFRK